MDGGSSTPGSGSIGVGQPESTTISDGVAVTVKSAPVVRHVKAAKRSPSFSPRVRGYPGQAVGIQDLSFPPPLPPPPPPCLQQMPGLHAHKLDQQGQEMQPRTGEEDDEDMGDKEYRATKTWSVQELQLLWDLKTKDRKYSHE